MEKVHPGMQSAYRKVMWRKLWLFSCFVTRQPQSAIFRKTTVEFLGFCRKSGVQGAKPHRDRSLSEVRHMKLLGSRR